MTLHILIVPLLIAGSIATAQDTDAVAQGASVYANNCRECHGPTAVEGEAGDIRGLGFGTVTSAVRGGPGMMPTVALSREEILAVVAYLGDL